MSAKDQLDKATEQSAKSIPFQLRMTPIEYAALKEIAQALGITKSAVVRKLILNEQTTIQRKQARRKR